MGKGEMSLSSPFTTCSRKDSWLYDKRVGMLVLSFTSCSRWDNRPCTLLEQHIIAGQGGGPVVEPEELTKPLSSYSIWVVSRTVLESSPLW